MPKADIINTTSRRRALRFGGIAALAGLIAPTIAATSGADAALIANCDEAMRLDRFAETADFDGADAALTT